MQRSDDEIQTLIAYARRKFGYEPFKLDPALPPVREALEKLPPKPALLPPPAPYVPSTLAKKKRR
jgi:hypothetical protein